MIVKNEVEEMLSVLAFRLRTEVYFHIATNESKRYPYTLLNASLGIKNINAVTRRNETEYSTVITKFGLDPFSEKSLYGSCVFLPEHGYIVKDIRQEEEGLMDTDGFHSLAGALRNHNRVFDDDLISIMQLQDWVKGYLQEFIWDVKGFRGWAKADGVVDVDNAPGVKKMSLFAESPADNNVVGLWLPLFGPGIMPVFDSIEHARFVSDLIGSAPDLVELITLFKLVQEDGVYRWKRVAALDYSTDEDDTRGLPTMILD